MSVTRRNGCADPMGAPPRGRRRSVSWPGAETNLDVETVLAAFILGVLADQRGGGCEIRTREGLPPTRFPSMRLCVRDGPGPSVTWDDRGRWASVDAREFRRMRLRMRLQPKADGLCTGLWLPPPSRGRGLGGRGLGAVGAVEQGLAAQLLGDAAGFAGRGRRGLVIAGAEQVHGMVEQAVGEVVGGGVLAQAGDRGGERRTGSRAGFGGDEAGAGQVAFGALHGG